MPNIDNLIRTIEKSFYQTHNKDIPTKTKKLNSKLKKFKTFYHIDDLMSIGVLFESKKQDFLQFCDTIDSQFYMDINGICNFLDLFVDTATNRNYSKIIPYLISYGKVEYKNNNIYLCENTNSKILRKATIFSYCLQAFTTERHTGLEIVTEHMFENMRSLSVDNFYPLLNFAVEYNEKGHKDLEFQEEKIRKKKKRTSL
jgi:hypothetical protein